MNRRTLLAFGTLVAVAATFTTKAAPVPVTAGVATYLSGGIGADEASVMQQEAKNYPLELEFVIKAAPKDEFTSDINVIVSDARKNVVFKTVSKGPFLLAKLPAGPYHIEASKNGQVKERNVAITQGSRQHLMFEWIE